MAEKTISSGLDNQDNGKRPKDGDETCRIDSVSCSNNGRNTQLQLDDAPQVNLQERLHKTAINRNLPFKKRRLNDDEIITGQEQLANSSTIASNDDEIVQNSDNGNAPSDKKLLETEFPNNGPGSRSLPRDAFCLSKVLSRYDVIPVDAKLTLQPHEASFLADDPELDKDHMHLIPRSYSKMLQAFDFLDREFHMQLSPATVGRRLLFQLSGGWSYFVRAHNLSAGDEIIFFKLLDENVAKDLYFVLRYFRRPKDRVIMKKMGSNIGDSSGRKDLNRRAGNKVRLKLMRDS